jgi:hypothetical protein
MLTGSMENLRGSLVSSASKNSEKGGGDTPKIIMKTTDGRNYNFKDYAQNIPEEEEQHSDRSKSKKFSKYGTPEQ